MPIASSIKFIPVLIALMFSFVMAADYQIVKAHPGDMDVYQAEMALGGTCSRALSINVPTTGKPLHFWLRAIGWGMEIHGNKDGKLVKREWVKFNSPNDWRWRKVMEFPAGQYDSITVIVPKPFDDKKQLAAALDCLIVTQEPYLDIQTCQGQIIEQLHKIHTTPQILPLPADDTFAINLQPVANIPANPQDNKLRVLSDQSLANTRMNLSGMELYLAGQQNQFVGVWKPVSTEQLKQREVNVAQGDDKVRVAVTLPERVTIPLSDRYTALSFMHTIKGAGELGDELFRYTINYEDNATYHIPIKEGERIGGQLKPNAIAMGNEVFNNLVDYRSVSLFISTWKNPYPQKKLISLTIEASKPKVIPILLAMAGHHTLLSQTVNEIAQNDQTNIHIDFTQPIKPVKDGLFGINVPYISKAESDRYFTLFREIDFASVRIWNRIHPKDGLVSPNIEELQKQTDAISKLVTNTRTKILLNLGALGKYPDDQDQLESYITQRCDWYMTVLGHLMDEHHLPIQYIEVFNEELIGHKDAPLKYRYYNQLAQRIKAKYPQLKIGGTAECWPDFGVMERFVEACGQNVDLLTWHMYATGKAATPTMKLMQATDQFAKSSRRLKEIFTKHYPEKPVIQAITEYNINYASWKPPYEERQNNGTGCTWTMSVLSNLLYHGEADAAMFWHYYSGGNYGIFDSQYQQRPARTLFYLLNRYLVDATLVNVTSDHEMVEVLAAETPHHFIVITINKSPATQTITPHISGLVSTQRLVLGSRYTIAGDQNSFSMNRASPFASFVLDGYGMQFEVLPK